MSDSNPSGSLSPSSPSMVEEKKKGNIILDKPNVQRSSQNSCANAGLTEESEAISKFRERPIPPLPPHPLKRAKTMNVNPKTRSQIWFHFTRLESDGNRAGCNYCGADYSCQPNRDGTGSLWRHFKERCKKNPYKLAAGQTTSEKCRAEKAVIAGQMTLEKCSAEKAVMAGQKTLEKCGIKKGLMTGQTTLDTFMVNKEPLIWCLLDAIEYWKHLQERVKTLDEQAAKQPMETVVVVKKSQFLPKEEGSSDERVIIAGSTFAT